MSCELPKCYSETHPKARKRHKCCDCRGWIEPGETYRVFSGIWDDPATYKFCADCDALRSEVDADVSGDEMTPFGFLGDTVGETGDPMIKARFVSIMRERRAKFNYGWIKDQFAFVPMLPAL